MTEGRIVRMTWIHSSPSGYYERSLVNESNGSSDFALVKSLSNRLTDNS